MTEQTNRLSLLDRPIGAINLVFIYELMSAVYVFTVLGGLSLWLMLLVGFVASLALVILVKVVKAVKKALVIRGWRSRLGPVLLLVFLVSTTLHLGLWALPLLVGVVTLLAAMSALVVPLHGPV
ncbi:MAG: hypothetical protein ERJ67_10200, partial [Aphanocapsa feldmannii 277cV]